MRELRTEIIINSTPEKIWNVLTDFEKYPEWNPFVLSIIGKPGLNEKLKVTIQSNSKPMVFKPTVTMFQKNERFAWLGHLFFNGLFDGHHIFEIKEIDEAQCLFVHREEFKGLLVSLFWKDLNTKTRAGFEAMNEKIKTLSEA